MSSARLFVDVFPFIFWWSSGNRIEVDPSLYPLFLTKFSELILTQTGHCVQPGFDQIQIMNNFIASYNAYRNICMNTIQTPQF
jgi:hypothetical protein